MVSGVALFPVGVVVRVDGFIVMQELAATKRVPHSHVIRFAHFEDRSRMAGPNIIVTVLPEE